jgi:hypothetical protein
MIRPVAVLALLALIPAGCGRDGPSSRSGARPGAASAVPSVDASTPEALWPSVHAAFAAGDLAALRPLLTEDGYVRLTHDLEVWRSFLVDPSTGPRLATRVRLPDDPAARDLAQRAIKDGEPSALLRVYVLAAPRPALVALPVVARAPDVVRDDLEVPSRDGETRPVRFLRGPSGWRVDRLPL